MSGLAILRDSWPAACADFLWSPTQKIEEIQSGRALKFAFEHETEVYSGYSGLMSNNFSCPGDVFGPPQMPKFFYSLLGKAQFLCF